jgi:Leucine-rich repeat (LRR) protein
MESKKNSEDVLDKLSQSIANKSTVIDLSDNNLADFPQELMAGDFIEELDLSNNPIDNCPSWIKNLKKLKRLNLSSCELTELPEELAKLKSLEILLLANSEFDVFPPVISQLQCLKELDLECCGIKRTPENRTQLSRLEILNLSQNELCLLLEELLPTEADEDALEDFFRNSMKRKSGFIDKIMFIQHRQQVNRAVSFNAIKNFAQELLCSDEVSEVVIRRLENLFLTNPISHVSDEKFQGKNLPIDTNSTT